MSFSPSLLRRLSPAAALVPLALLAGCANMTTTATGVSGPVAAVTLKGGLHGGNQPITGATVQVWAVGTTGYGSTATLYATTTSANDAYGSFAFSQVTNDGTVPAGNFAPASASYSCPTTGSGLGDVQMYLLAKRGVTVAGSSVLNNAVAFIAPLGKCSGAASKFMDLNEVTTVASMAALQQYFNPNGEYLGYPNTTQAATAFANAVATANNLANMGTGTATPSFAPSSSVAGVTMTAVPEYQKINTIANILAACVNTSSANIFTYDPKCSTLFTNAVAPPSAAVTSQPTNTYQSATDVLVAAYYMFVNPTNSQDPTGKTANLYALAGGIAAPFQPSVSAQPLDWSIGITYTPTGTCTSAAAATFLSSAESIAIDSVGNVWFNNGQSGATGAVGSLSATGAPTGCYFGTIPSGRGLAIDANNNVWATGSNGTNSVYEVLANGTTLNWPTSAAANGIAVDGSGNVFYVPSGSATPLQMYANGAAATTTAAGISVGGNITSSTAMLYLAADTSGRLWAPTTSSQGFYELYPDATATSTNNYTLVNVGTAIGTTVLNNDYGAAIDSTGRILGGNTCCTGTPSNSAWAVTPSSTAGTATGALGTRFLGGLVAPRSSAVDGAGNVWFGMGYPELISTTNIYALAEMNNALTTGLSPNGSTPGTCASSGTNCQVNGGFQKDALGTVRSLAIDPSGNVWAASTGTTQTIIEIVGQAVPVVTPIALGVKNGTLGTKP